MDAVAESGGNPVSKHHIQSEYGDEQTDAGRDGRTRLARTISQARTRTGKKCSSLSADLEQDWQPYPVDLIHTLLKVLTIHTYDLFLLLLLL